MKRKLNTQFVLYLEWEQTKAVLMVVVLLF